jgi:hypothetical protein
MIPIPLSLYFAPLLLHEVLMELLFTKVIALYSRLETKLGSGCD